MFTKNSSLSLLLLQFNEPTMKSQKMKTKTKRALA